MNDKLTLQDCFKYPNARIKITHEDYAHPRYYELVEMIGWMDDMVIKDVHVEAGKLILRKIGSLTAGEQGTVEEMIADQVLSGASPFKQVKVLDYLRSINIDIDGFIESGKAIEEK